MKNCVLITNEFPYFSGEPFLSNEIPFLSKAFQNVYIFAINAKDTDELTRAVPGNVHVYPLGSLHTKLKYLVFMLLGFFTCNKSLNTKEKTLKEKLVCFYAKGRALDVYKRIYKIIVRENINIENSVIYSFWFTYQAIAAWLLKETFTKKGKTVKAISRAHGYDLYWERSSAGYLPYQDVLLDKLDCTYTCSKMGKNYLVDKYPSLSGKIVVSKLGTSDYGITPYECEEKVLVTCCNLEPLKRMTLFAKAFCKVCDDVPNCKWICIGSGAEYEQIKEIISNAGLESKVTLTGRMPNTEVLEYYRNNPVMYFCNVSTTEGLPVSIMEALSFGIPVLATDVGGTSELVNDHNGMLMKADITIDELASILKKFLNVEQLDYLKMRESARSIWENEVCAQKNYMEFCEKISQL